MNILRAIINLWKQYVFWVRIQTRWIPFFLGEVYFIPTDFCHLFELDTSFRNINITFRTKQKKTLQNCPLETFENEFCSHDSLNSRWMWIRKFNPIHNLHGITSKTEGHCWCFKSHFHHCRYWIESYCPNYSCQMVPSWFHICLS